MNDLTTISRNLPRVAPPVSDLARLAVLAEQNFLTVGNHLEHANGDIGELKVLFEKIETGLGAEASVRFAEKIGELSSRADSVRKILGSFTDSTDLLDAASRKVALQISDLDRVVRTIATLAITARVIGHALSPPEKKVVAFVENLTQMSLEADAILSDVTSSMAQIQAEMQELPGTVEKLNGLLSQDVLRHLSSLTCLADGIRSRGPTLVAANSDLQFEMAKVGSDISRVIVALQVGDAFRQRLGRVIETVEQAPRLANPASVCTSHTLAAALLRGAYEDTKGEVEAALASMADIERASTQAVQVARRTYLEDGDESGNSERLSYGARHLDAKLLDVEDHLSGLRERTERVVSSVKQMFARERTLRQIAHKVRLSGLNAIIICTQLGSRANALREVAQWLRAMTDEADEATEGLQRDLSAMRELIEIVGVSGLDNLSSNTAVIVSEGHGLLSEISAANQLVDLASDQIVKIGQALPRHLHPAQRCLSGFLASLGQAESFELALHKCTEVLPQTKLPFDPDTIEAGHFAHLRSGYTMARERQIHDQVLQLDAPSEMPAKDNVAPSAAAEDDLDDILF